MKASKTRSGLFCGHVFASIVAGCAFNVIKNEREKTAIMQQEKKWGWWNKITLKGIIDFPSKSIYEME